MESENASPKILPIAFFVIALSAITAGVPVLNYVVGLLAIASYPVVVFASGRNMAVMVALISVVAAALIGAPSAGFSLLLAVVLPGLIIGFAMRTGARAGRTIFWAFLPTFGILLLFILNYGVFKDSFSLMVDESIAQFAQLPGNNLDPETMKEGITSYAEKVFSILPALILLSGIFNVFVGYLISQKVLTAMRIEVPRVPNFNNWRPDYRLVGVFILGLFLTVFKLAGSDYVGWNILVFTGLIYFVAGLAVVESFFKASKIPLFFKILFYAGVFFAQLFSLVVLAGVGLFDSWFNFRSRSAE
ncbi:MAG: DUF2232 domain-containing protein [candidate division Zixibacteria bacterium]|nr:DUF2232 domain-containing protein [candidate division Zixibacteria bacterium]